MLASVAIVPGCQQFEHNPAGIDLCTTGAFLVLGFGLSLRLKTGRVEDWRGIPKVRPSVFLPFPEGVPQ
jgi:hypothetical protein